MKRIAFETGKEMSDMGDDEENGMDDDDIFVACDDYFQWLFAITIAAATIALEYVKYR